MASYHFSDQAEQDLNDIIDYTLAEWGSAQTNKYIDGLEQRCQMLADNPNIGTDRNQLLEGLFSFPYESHVLFYKMQLDGITIIRVLHKHMEPDQNIN